MWYINLFWCLLGIWGGALVSTFFYILSIKRKSILCEITTTTLISNSVSTLERLSIKYNGKSIPNLYVSTIKIKNQGNTILELDDFAPKAPLLISTSGEFLISYDAGTSSYIENNYHNLYPLFNLGEENKCNSAYIRFDYLSKKETISFTVFHTENILISGKLKEGKVIIIDNT